MKINQLKVFALIGLLTLSVFAFSSFIQEASGGILTMRTIEVTGGSWDSKIVIVNEKGETQEIPLEQLRSKDFMGNTQKINENVNRLKAQGYELKGMSGGAGNAVLINTYTFEKK